jgi:hypothetical protein
VSSDELTPEQLQWLCEFINPLKAKLYRLRSRMEHSFLPGDPAFEKIKAVENAVHDLAVWLHYKKCEVRRKN